MANILIVDDNPDQLELLSLTLVAVGHKVRTASDGGKALNAVAAQAPDLVLLDVEMPVLSGPETAYHLFVRDCGDEDIPLVLLSGVVGLEKIAATVGTPYFLGKPYTSEALIQVVDRALHEKIAPRPRLAS